MPDEGGKVVVTFKAEGGWDAPWIVIHADDPQEAWDLIRDIGPVDGVNEDTSLGQLVVMQARNFQQAYSGSSSLGGARRTSSSGSNRSGTTGGRASGGRSTSGGTSRGGGKGQSMKSDQWPDGMEASDFDECPKHGPLIFKDEFEKNGKVVSARVTCSTPFCNAVPTYWENEDGEFEAN